MVLTEIDGIVELPLRGLLLAPDAAGVMTDVTIGGESGNSSFRDFRRASLWKWASLIGCLSPTWMDNTSCRLSQSRAWPVATGVTRLARITSLFASARLQISIGANDGEDPPTQLNGLASEFEGWFRIVKNWICAWTDHVRELPSSEDHCQVHATVSSSGGQVALYGSRVIMEPVVFGERPVSRKELLAAFDRASAGEDISEPVELSTTVHYGQMAGRSNVPPALRPVPVGQARWCVQFCVE